MNTQSPGENKRDLRNEGMSPTRFAELSHTHLSPGSFNAPIGVIDFKHLRDAQHGASVLKLHQGPDAVVPQYFIRNLRSSLTAFVIPFVFLPGIADCDLSTTVNGVPSSGELFNAPDRAVDQKSLWLVLKGIKTG